MPVKFYLSAALHPFSGGRERIEIGGSPATAGEAFEALWVVCPALRDRIVTETGEIREHVGVFVGPEDVRFTGGLSTPLSDDAEISIYPAITGG